MSAVYIPSDFVFIEYSFFDVMNGLVEEASGSGSDLFLIRVQADVHLEGVNII